MGGSAASKLPAHAHVLTARECQKAFAYFDTDDTGLMEYPEMQEAFNTMMAPATVDITAFEGTTFTPNKFRDMVESVARQFPQYEVIWNLKRYISEQGDDDGVDLTDIALTKVFNAYDADGTGHLDLGEIMKMFTFLKIPLKILVAAISDQTFEDNKLTPDEFMALMRQLDEQNPWAEIDEKISTLAGGLGEGAPDLADQNADPDADTAEAEGTEGIPEGNKKALLVGINYIGSSCELGGCINDVRNEKDMLIEKFGFSEDNILMLTEDQDDDSKLPNAQTIRDGFAWLLDGAAEGDFLFFAYSGHGSQLPNKDGTEPDGKNEILCPLDLQDDWYANSISDDYLNDVFFDQLPEGVRCLIMYDCCHSGSMTDLGVTREFGPPPAEELEIKHRFLDPPEEIMAEITAAKEAAACSRSIGPGDRDPGAKMLWTISGCQDHQTSADATIGGQRQGAMTWALRESLEEGGQAGSWTYRYENLVNTMRRKLGQRGFSQVPALCSTQVELLERFYLDQTASP